MRMLLSPTPEHAVVLVVGGPDRPHVAQWLLRSFRPRTYSRSHARLDGQSGVGPHARTRTGD
jgi:hypothetical protein